MSQMPTGWRTGIGLPMNQTQSSGLKHMASAQELSSVIMMTSDMERMYSPELSLASISGIKARIVVRDEVSSGMASVFPVARQAAFRSSPRSRRERISSAMTMPLSTSIPRAMIDDAIDTRSSSMPKKRKKAGV